MLVSQELFDETLLESQELFENSNDDAVQETISELQSSGSHKAAIRLDHLSLTHPDSPEGREDRAKQTKFENALKDRNLIVATAMLNTASERDFPMFMSLVLKNGLFRDDAAASTLVDKDDESVSLLLNFTIALLPAAASTHALAKEIKLQLSRPLQQDWFSLFYKSKNSNVSMRLGLIKWARTLCNACESNKKTFVQTAIEFRPENDDDADQKSGLELLVQSLPNHINEEMSNQSIFISEVSKLTVILGKFQAASEPQPKDGEEPLVSSAHANVKEFYRAGAVGRLHLLAKQSADDRRDELLCDILAALRVMAIDNDIVQNMVAVGILETAQSSLLVQEAISAPLAAATLGLFRNLCANDEIKSTVCRNSLAAILHVMETHTSYHAVQEHGCGILGAMALRQPRNAVMICNANGAHYILQAMQSFADKVPLQRQGCLAIRNIASRLSVEEKQVILDAGAESILKTIPAMHQGSVEEAYAALRDLGITAIMYKYDENGEAQTTQMFGNVKSNFRPVYE